VPVYVCFELSVRPFVCAIELLYIVLLLLLAILTMAWPVMMKTQRCDIFHFAITECAIE